MVDPLNTVVVYKRLTPGAKFGKSCKLKIPPPLPLRNAMADPLDGSTGYECECLHKSTQWKLEAQVCQEANAEWWLHTD